jgi:D-alanyl-D-alanine carboxypeptidase
MDEAKIGEEITRSELSNGFISGALLLFLFFFSLATLTSAWGLQLYENYTGDTPYSLISFNNEKREVVDLLTTTDIKGTQTISENELSKQTNNYASGKEPAAWLGDSQNSVYEDPVMVSSCEDCKYYPVSKRHALSASYEPAVVETGLPGGGQVTPETRAALQDLFNAARAAGLSPKVNSAYRSYQTQANTFNYWVEREVAKGFSREQAERNANRYSARPGHSEHQLGTTVDINCLSCSPFDRSSNGNDAIWEFVGANAHKFGFVVSYPEGKEDLTGYVYEPWHIRYVGVDIAKELYEIDYLGKQNGIYLERYLLNERLF